MHDRFEKEVQKKMEELNLVPSAPVWEKIEIEIRPEKKRRRVIFWLFFGLLLLGGGFLTYQTMKEEKQTAGSIPVGQSSDSETTTAVPSPKENDVIIREIDKANKTSITETKTQKEITQQINTKAYPVPTAKNPIILKKRDERTVLTKPEKPNQNITTANPLPGKPEGPQSKEEAPKKIDISDLQVQKNVAEEEKPGLSTDSVASSAPKIINDSTATPAQKAPATMRAAADSSVKKKVASKKEWKRNVAFSVGKSDYITGHLFNFSPVSFDASSYQSPLTSGNPQAISRPSDINSGLAFAVGFSLSKKMSDHFEISIGLQYAHYSTTIKVGSSRRNDTVTLSNGANLNASRSYGNGFDNKNTYTNRFHAVELPVTISWQPALNLPLYISAGAAYGQVLNTNALSFSSASNVYYPDRDNYVRQMLPLFSSVQVGLFEKKKIPVRIGPMLQYNAKKLKKTNTGDTPHLYFAGIKSTINF